jgi:RNAse (barnase) inhibitor barstar
MAEENMLRLDLRGIENEEKFHEYVSKRCGFPEFYGKNFDAFHDCLTSPELNAIPKHVVFEGLPEFRINCPSGYKKLIPILRDCSKQVHDRRIQWSVGT